MNQADANSPAAISGNSNKPDQKPSTEDFQSGKGAALSRIFYCSPPQRDQNARHVPEPADSVQAALQHRKIPVHTCGCQSVCKRIESWKLTVWKNGFRVSGSETDLPDFLYKVPPVYLSAKFIGMKVVPEVFRQMRYKPEPVDHFHV